MRDGNKYKYVNKVVQGKELSVHLYDGEVEGARPWLGSLCGATREDIDLIIEWLKEIKASLKQ